MKLVPRLQRRFCVPIEFSNNFQALRVLTTDALTARPGSRAMIERLGGPTTLEGRVRSVEPAAFAKVSALGVEEQHVRVLIDITSPQAQWQATLTASVGASSRWPKTRRSRCL